MFTTPFAFMASSAGGPVLWTPADITTLGWWDASDAATVTLSGSNVTQWDDKSGNAYNGTQSTFGLQPTYGTNTLNSLNLVTFDGSDRLILPTIAYNASKNLSIYSVGRKTSTAGYQVAFVANRSGNDSAALLYNFPTIEKWGTYTNGDKPANTSTVSGTYAIFSLLGNSTDNVYFWFNGSSDGSQTGWTASTVFSSGGIGNDQFGSALTGDIAEIVMIDAEDSTASRERMEGYLAWKWGLQANLPVGHPYKNSPPYVNPPAPSYLLDTYPGAKRAYSVRRLSSSYSGPAIRVRRSSDNAEQDIGFVGEDLDTSALTSFVGANDGYVKIWYDQSGNGENASQTTTTKQSTIVSSGTIYTAGTKPAIYASVGRSYMTFTPFTTDAVTQLIVGKKASSTSDKMVGFSSSTSTLLAHYNDSNIYFQWTDYYAYPNSAISNTDYEVILATTLTTSTSAIWRNGSSLALSNTYSAGIDNSYDFLFTYQNDGSSNNSNAYEQELIVWDSGQNSNAIGIQDNVNAYYSIY